MFTQQLHHISLLFRQLIKVMIDMNNFLKEGFPFFCYRKGNSKLYFEAFGINSMLQNNLPHAGEGNAPKSHFRQKTDTTKIQKIWQQKKTDRVRSDANPKPTPAGIVTQST
jgi:hypothetical protein